MSGPEEQPRRRGLGRGLSALLGEAAPEPTPEAGGMASRPARTLPIEALRPGRFQPRRSFDPQSIAELAASMREKGVLQPILVRSLAGSAVEFEIVAGERRWRAAQAAGLHEVPVVVRDFSDAEALEVALVENLQRQDLSPLEEADGYRRLMDEFSHTQEELAQRLGKSRSHLANTLRLLSLPEPVKKLVDEGKLTAGHARAVLAAGDPLAIANQIVERGLSVRQAEALTQKTGSRSRPAAPPNHADADQRALERDLEEALGIDVSLKVRGSGGELILRYRTLEQLDDLIRRLGRG